jgi:hypothetical protein
LAQVSLQLDEIASAEEYLLEASTNVSEKDRPWINYGWALMAEKRGEWQASRNLGSRALEQFTRLGQKSGAQKCQRLLARLPSLVDCNGRKDVSQVNE